MAIGENKTVIYDARRGTILLIEGTVPDIRIEMSGKDLQAKWGFKATKRTSGESAATLRVDLPSLLRSNVRAREVESLSGGKYRLTQTAESGDRLIATVDSLLPFAFTGIEIHAKERQAFTLDLWVNQQAPTFAFSMPQIKTLRARFKVETIPALESMKDAARITSLQLLPLAFGTDSESRKLQDQLDKWLDEKLDWRAMEARYKRDLPRLRQLMPMPQ
jgi:hypothetical protein